MSEDPRARGGRARAKALSPKKRSEIAKIAAEARWNPDLPQAVYTGDLTIGDMVFPCSVLSDGSRILTQTDFMKGMGMYYSGWVARNRPAEDVAADVPHFLGFKSLRPFIDKHLGDLQSIVVRYRTERGNVAHGIKAEIIPKICDVWLDADEYGQLGSRQKKIAQKAKLIIRALAHIGIIALVDEATGYQRQRAADALAQILEAFIAKELRPWVKTFPDQFYEEMFRLRGLKYPKDRVSRPRYFGHLTNDVIYKRLAPGILEELKKITPKRPSGRRKGTFPQRLTEDVGHPKLREHLSAVIAVMQLSDDYDVFVKNLDRVKPRYGETFEMFPDAPETGL